RQVMSATIFGVVVLSFVLVLGNIFKELLQELVKRPDMDMGYVLGFILNVLPFSLIFTIPWGFLTAVLLVFGRLSADNELISLRMMGLSMPRICASVLILSLMLTGVSYYLNISVAPQARRNLKGMVFKMAVDDPMKLINSDEVITAFPGHLIYVEEKIYDEATDSSELHNLQLIELDQKKRPIRYVSAETADLRTEESEDGELLMVLELFDAYIETKDAADPRDYSKISPGIAQSTTLSVSLEKLREKHNRVNPSIMTVGEIREQLSKGEDEIKDELRSSLRTEISKRLSFSMACVTFGLIAIPLGVTAQRRETSIGFALSLVIACVYFLGIIFADTFRDEPGSYPHLLMWLPNLIFIGLGLFLFRRMNRK
ncbi:MAG: LptF/LptG family permease, partial [Verrucomicrobiales bacterium]